MLLPFLIFMQKTKTDAYFALGYLHAQDRLFQMEMIRRLAKGELAEVLGPELVLHRYLFQNLAVKAVREGLCRPGK